MIALPSATVPLMITSRSLPVSAIVTVCSLGAVPVLYFDLALLSFQVPAKGSAATRAAASPKIANASFAYRIVSLLCGGIIPRSAFGAYRGRGDLYGIDFGVARRMLFGTRGGHSNGPSQSREGGPRRSGQS